MTGKTTDSTAPPGPRMPRREVWLDVGEAYPGFRVKLWSNFPVALAQDLDSGDEQRLRRAIAEIVVEHNGWCDFDGQPLPPASDPAFWEAVPLELAGALVALVREAVSQLGKSIATRASR